MKSEAEIRSALFNWRAAAGVKVPEDLDEETLESLNEMKRHAQHYVGALEWVLS